MQQRGLPLAARHTRDTHLATSGHRHRIREVAEGPDGNLYFSTSNRDGRGDPAPDDDRILRVSPAGP